MITGFNTDVKHAGKVFHVQTEDKGMNNPRIETLIYVGGQIIDSIRQDYSDKIKDGYNEDLINQLMEEQHQKVIRDIKTGKYDTENEEIETIISNKKLDDVVLEYLLATTFKDDLVLLLDEEGIEFFDNSDVEITVNAYNRESYNGIPRTKILIKILSLDTNPVLLSEGYTDNNGKFKAQFKIPELPDNVYTLLIEGEHPEIGKSQIKYIIKKKRK